MVPGNLFLYRDVYTKEPLFSTMFSLLRSVTDRLLETLLQSLQKIGGFLSNVMSAETDDLYKLASYCELTHDTVNENS